LIKPSPFKIKPAQKKDIPSLALVFQAAFSHKLFFEKWTLTAAKKRLVQILEDKQVVGWVATVYGQPVGFSFLQTRQGARETYGELLETAVHPYFQEQGIEQGLLRSVKVFQKKKRIRNVMTFVYQGKHEQLFKKAGWSKAKKTIVYVSR
jgi:ribosomal protein S18 acetylase RimI-like enzyme